MIGLFIIRQRQGVRNDGEHRVIDVWDNDWNGVFTFYGMVCNQIWYKKFRKDFGGE